MPAILSAMPKAWSWHLQIPANQKMNNDTPLFRQRQNGPIRQLSARWLAAPVKRILACRQQPAVLFLALTVSLLVGEANAAAGDEIRDLCWFLHRLKTVDHLPELEDSHTAMSSTWNPAGGDPDGFWFRGMVDQNTNILLDVDGPGCVHRIFNGIIRENCNVHIQIFVDRAAHPVIDLPIQQFFDYEKGPFPYPLVFHKTYPGILFPLPYKKHIKIQLFDPENKPVEYLKGVENVTKMFRQKDETEKISHLSQLQDEGKGWLLPRSNKWGNFWQVVYTTYAADVDVKSLSYPFNKTELAAMDAVARKWLQTESTSPMPRVGWTVDQVIALNPGQVQEISLEGPAVIEEFQAGVLHERGGRSNDKALRKQVRLQFVWDDALAPSVDLPLGHLFGNADLDWGQTTRSLLLGVFGGQEATDGFVRFPMPFAKRAVLRLHSEASKPLKVLVRMASRKLEAMPGNWAYFHATWRHFSMSPKTHESLPRYGRDDLYPFFVALEREGVRGKYVGLLHQINMPDSGWWGEGDPLIWSDEPLSSWPPSYHGTGSEEYFNSGWCDFDKKAVSGIVAEERMRPGPEVVYSFHLNDHFQFRRSFRAAFEINPWPKKWEASEVWRCFTAFWYASAPQGAGSDAGISPPSR